MMQDETWEWHEDRDGGLIATTHRVVAWHLAKAARVAWRDLKLGIASVTKDGRLQLRLESPQRTWFTPALPEDPATMSWEALLVALAHLANLEASRRATAGSVPFSAHGGLDLRSVATSGEVRGHYLTFITLDAVAKGKDLVHGLIPGDPRFAAPELWAGEEPTYASDLFALAALFCHRARPMAGGARRIDRDFALTLLPRQRVPEYLPGDYQAKLLSLLDVSPHNRSKVVSELVLQKESSKR